MSRGIGRSTSHVAIIDRELANVAACGCEFTKSSLTLKDRAAFNMKVWKGFLVG
jgi:hypothetical protein